MNYLILNLFDKSDTLPNLDVDCKFSLIESLTEIWLVFGPLEIYRYHAQLIHKFCSMNNVACSWLKNPDLVEIHDPDYEIKGGGIIILDDAKKTIEFKGSSTAYGKFDKALLEEFIQNAGEFNGIKVILGT